MEIKEAVEIFREESQKLLCDSTERDFQAYSKAIYVISNALKDGYTLCKVDEAVGKMENNRINETFIDSSFCTVGKCIEIIKEACK